MGILCLTACVDKAAIPVTGLPEITKWAQAGVDPAALLTSEPAVCLNLPEKAEARRKVLLGRAAFRSPYLLGGQAARRGFSCNACHTNGGVNLYFYVEGMSSEPGTADVTSFHFSKTLGDEIFNPKPIPSLVHLPAPETEEQIVARTAFVLRLIEKEFDGEAPNALIKEALLSYVEALDERSCNGVMLLGREILTHRLDLIGQLVELISTENDKDTAEFLRASLRAELGRLHAYYRKPKTVQDSLTAFSQQVKFARETDAEDVSDQWKFVRENALANYDNSLFAPDLVKRYFPADE